MTREQIDKILQELRTSERAGLEEVDPTEVYCAAEFEAHRNGISVTVRIEDMGPIATPRPAIGATSRPTTVSSRRVTPTRRRSWRYSPHTGKTLMTRPGRETTALPARCPAPVTPLPPQGSAQTLTFSMPIDSGRQARAAALARTCSARRIGPVGVLTRLRDPGLGLVLVGEDRRTLRTAEGQPCDTLHGRGRHDRLPHASWPGSFRFQGCLHLLWSDRRRALR